MTLPFDLERSGRRCPRCYKALALQHGQDGDGGLTDQHYCLHCDYVEPARPTAAVPITRREVRVLAQQTRRLLLGPSCRGRRHPKCTASGCECPCHKKEVA